jgi:hypothetical protein
MAVVAHFFLPTLDKIFLLMAFNTFIHNPNPSSVTNTHGRDRPLSPPMAFHEE